LFPSFEASYLKTKTKKRRRSKKSGLEAQEHVPRAWNCAAMGIGHEICASGI